MESIREKNKSAHIVVDKKMNEFLSKYEKHASGGPQPPEHPKEPVFLAKDSLLSAIKCLLGIGVCGIVLYIGIDSGNTFMGVLMVIAAFAGVILALMFLISFIGFFVGLGTDKKDKQKYNDEMRKYSHDLHEYENHKEVHIKKVQKMKTECQKFRSEANKHKLALDNESTELTSMLQKAYDANIIPKQFRNIQGVYYLYDYLSTSHQSLSEALMQCNLEAIKQKLDKMIQLQSEQIIQQAITNAKLDQVYEVAEATMNNTALAAKYSAIAAVNSEITKRLASKQLAYQAADFWLK